MDGFRTFAVIFTDVNQCVEVTSEIEGNSRVTIHNSKGDQVVMVIPTTGVWTFYNKDDAGVRAIRAYEAAPGRWSHESTYLPFPGVPPVKSLKIRFIKTPCVHDYVEMGFMHSKMVCRHCNQDRG